MPPIDEVHFDIGLFKFEAGRSTGSSRVRKSWCSVTAYWTQQKVEVRRFCSGT